MTPVEITSGDSPLILGLPHTGTHVPDGIRADLTPRGQMLADTDWHVDRLYADLLPGATTVRATFHRYVIDANRDPSGQSLYPGQNTTGLVPLTDFDGVPLWRVAPSEAEIARRRNTYHAAYHAALAGEIARIRALHGVAILYDCHSIRSQIPFLFDGPLPDFNVGTNGTTTCAPEIEALVAHICEDAQGFTSVTNGRFKGGWTTRHYGQPRNGVHSIQMELAQSTYLQTETPPFAFAPDKADKLRPHLQAILQGLQTLAPTLKGRS